MPTLTENFTKPGDVAPEDVVTAVELWGLDELTGYDLTAGKSIGGKTYAIGNQWTLPNMVGNADIEVPTGTVYKLSTTWPGLKKPKVRYVTLPTTGGPYVVGDILADPPAALTPSALSAHTADTALHGGGQEVFYAAVAANFVTASTTFVTIPGGSATFTVPDRPFQIYGTVPFNTEEVGRWAEIRLLGGGATQIDWNFSPPGSVVGQAGKLWLHARIPGPTWSPTVGAPTSVAVQIKSSAATSDVTVLVDFGGPFQLCEIQGTTC